MGISYSFSASDYESIDDNLEELIMRSISFKREEVNSAIRSLSFNGRDSDPYILKAFGSGKMIIKGSLSFKKRENDPFHVETKFSIKSPRAEDDDSTKTTSHKTEPGSPKYKAAVKLQKVYKSFRTRRKLADCAVLVEQRWWKLLDFALLKRTSVSFFDIERPESVISRWSRARTRAAMVGKGLSKDEKARKLALQHWLEAIDPRHRYGHNLHLYYVSWLQCESRQPFFYWLDVGEGKEVNLERCPRSKLQQQCIKYLGPKEREIYEVIIQNGKFVYKQTGKTLDTSEGPKDSKWIFVLSTSKQLYVGQKKKGTFQHSSFLAGGATSAAGRIVVEEGILKVVWPHSGHYRPTEENFEDFMSFLKDKKLDLTDVKKSPTDDEEEESCGLSASVNKQRSHSSGISSTEGAIETDTKNLDQENEVQQPHASDAQEHIKSSETDDSSRDKDTSAFDRLYTLCIQNLFRQSEGDSDKTLCEEEWKGTNSSETRSEKIQHGDGGERANEPSACGQHYAFHKWNLFAEEEQNESEEQVVARELILHRINSKKRMKSLQLGKQLSCKWTTGAGPRIGIVRDYPSELQFQALEQVDLSPRTTSRFNDHASLLRDSSSLTPRSP